MSEFWMQLLIDIGISYLYAHAVMGPLTLLVYLLIGPPLGTLNE